MGFGFSRYYDCCDIPEGYGDGPCGGYYCYKEKCRRDHKQDRKDGCCEEHDRGKGCCNERGRDFRCNDFDFTGCGCFPFGCGPGWNNGCFPFGCGPGWNNQRCGCFPFGCGPGWNNQRCGLFLNIPFGGCNMGFFMPFNNRFDSFDT